MVYNYAREPKNIIQSETRDIYVFSINGENIDEQVISDFGEEWSKFNYFADKVINDMAEEYFDILNDEIVNQHTYAIDIGCGTGRWTKYIASKAGFVEAVDPSDAIFVADRLLADVKNVRLSKASVDTLPFDDEIFDFAMSIGVLHHIPDTPKALMECVKKIKKGGYFYVYLYYNLDRRGSIFKILFRAADLLRNVVSKLPSKIKRAVCDILAVLIYMPLILLSRLLSYINLKRFAQKIPLSAYNNKPFFVIRNDALDRFGTRLEQRFSKREVKEMMERAGLSEIVVSNGIPFYHAIGKKI
ncbi:MAG TPA: class I SAM-dependent methyltransferase [Chitinophagaceae bacterium]|nr:class I SAM-dependent methyltransferase [Chitinophagaceae bacterium]